MKQQTRSLGCPKLKRWMAGQAMENEVADKKRPQRRTFDWTQEPRPDNLTPFQEFILDIDWNKSPLGPMRQWPTQLRQMILLVIQDSDPAGEYYTLRPSVFISPS